MVDSVTTPPMQNTSVNILVSPVLHLQISDNSVSVESCAVHIRSVSVITNTLREL